MKRVVSVNNMRISDAATIAGGVPGRELMLRAGQGIYETIYGEKGYRPFKEELKTCILCGTGNNAGDGYVVAQILKSKGGYADLLLAKEKFSVDGGFYYDRCKELLVNSFLWEEVKESFDLSKYDVVIDCLLGTGFKGEPKGEIREIIEAVNKLWENNKEDRPLIISVDINSGLNGDNGLSFVAVKSDLTISIGDYMSGLFLNEAKDLIGRLINIDIGINIIEKPYYLIEASDVKAMLPDRLNMSNKGTYGYIALVGGSQKYTGAITLAGMANAAMRSGAGVVLVAAPAKICPMISDRILESTVYPLDDNDGNVIFNKQRLDELISRVKVIAFGMGIGDTPDTQKILKYLLDNYTGILLIDADGLNSLAELIKGSPDILMTATCKKVVLTPHVKEFSRLLEASGTSLGVKNIQEDSINLTKAYAKNSNVIVLLKGPTTIITDGEQVYLSNTGCPGMATAGSGDVLSGILGAICAYVTPTLDAVAVGAYINGYAGELAQEEFGDISMLASDTVNNIAKAIKLIRG